MKSLKIDFSKPGQASLIVDQEVDGADNVAQKAAVNILTRRGTDKLHPGKGVTLDAEASSGFLFNELSAMHSTNFAALETRKFLRNFISTEAPLEDVPLRISLQLSALRGTQMLTNLFVELRSGETIGKELTSSL